MGFFDKSRANEREQAGTTDKTYTKSDVMAALSALKTPTEIELECCRRLTGADDGTNGTDAMEFALVGAEALADALLDGLDANQTRVKLTDAVAKVLSRKVLRQISEILSDPADLLRNSDKGRA